LSRRGGAIATLTLNPAVDLSADVDRLEPERKLRCRDLRYDPGGGGVNVARMIRRLGGSATAVFTAGGASGQRLRALLTAERISQLVIPVAEETRQDFTVRDLGSGEQFRFVMPGPKLKNAEWRHALAAARDLDPGIIVASGSVPPGVPDDVYARLAMAAKKRRARVALDAPGPALRAGLAAGVWLIKPNLRELEDVCGAGLGDEGARLQACRFIVTSGAAEIVALSLGPEGALLVTREGAWRAAPPAIAPASTIGAGDSFLAGLVWALARGSTPADALRTAVAAAAATLLAPGTGLGRGADVRGLRAAVQVEKLGAEVLEFRRAG
jgi:6-phosphofructokinase 2